MVLVAVFRSQALSSLDLFLLSCTSTPELDLRIYRGRVSWLCHPENICMNLLGQNSNELDIKRFIFFLFFWSVFRGKGGGSGVQFETHRDPSKNLKKE